MQFPNQIKKSIKNRIYPAMLASSENRKQSVKSIEHWVIRPNVIRL